MEVFDAAADENAWTLRATSPKARSAGAGATALSARSARSTSHVIPSERRPGVSISSAPLPGSRLSARRVVVCRPRSSFARTARVGAASGASARAPAAAAASPRSALRSDDLPTPDEPSSAYVRPRSSSAASSILQRASVVLVCRSAHACSAARRAA